MSEGSACSDFFALRDKVSRYYHEVCGLTVIFLSQILRKEKQTAYYQISLIYMLCSQIYCKMSTIMSYTIMYCSMLEVMNHWFSLSQDGVILPGVYGMVRNIYLDSIFQWHMMLILICTVLDSVTFSEMPHSKNMQ